METVFRTVISVRELKNSIEPSISRNNLSNIKSFFLEVDLLFVYFLSLQSDYPL